MRIFGISKIQIHLVLHTAEYHRKVSMRFQCFDKKYFSSTSPTSWVKIFKDPFKCTLKEEIDSAWRNRKSYLERIMHGWTYKNVLHCGKSCPVVLYMFLSYSSFIALINALEVKWNGIFVIIQCVEKVTILSKCTNERNVKI